MKMISGSLVRLAFVSALLLGAEARATQLTFDLYTDAAKTTPVANNTVVPATYGDNVSDFDPSAPVGGQYYRYGTNGGLTPHVTIDYRFWNNPGDNGGANGRIWNTGYGNLTNVVYPTVTASYVEMRLVPDFGYRVTLTNFDIASFTAATTGQTLKILRDAGLPSASVLWSAGPDGTVTVNGGAGVHNSYAPNVLVEGGHTLSLIYGQSGNIGVDNVVFIESIPEPTAMAFLALGSIILRWRLRRE